MRNPWPIVLLALLILGCCFGDFAQGFNQGMALGTECPAVTAVLNASVARMQAVPEPLEGVASPTPEQAIAAWEPLAASYEAAASDLSSVNVTNPELLAERNELAAIYREGAVMLRSQGQQVAASLRGEATSLDGAQAAGEDLDRREQAVIDRINMTCAQFQ